MGRNYTQLAGAPPAATKLAWRDWYFRLLRARLDEVPLARTTTYYVATNGSDSNNGLSTAAPFATLAKVQTVLTASSGDVRFRFRRGDVWEESNGIAIAKTNVTLDDWSDSTTGFKAAPRFSRFLLKYSSAGWSAATGNRYTRAETSTVAWVRYQTNHFGTIFIRAASAAECESTSNSFYWASNVLHINLGGTNPNTVNLEAAADNNVIGVEVQNVDGVRLRNLRVDGFGAYSSNGYTIKVANGDLKACVVENCEAYYGGYHVMGHNEGSGSATGGVCTFLNCRSGLAYKGGSGSGWVTHHSAGGQETIWHCCEAAYGALPETSWYNASSRPRYGSAVFGHTGGSPYKVGLVISYGMHIANNSFGCESGLQMNGADCPAATTLENARVFVVGENMLGVQPCGTMNIGLLNHVYINCQWHVTVQSGSTFQDSQCQGWVINCSLVAERSNVIYNSGANGPHYPRWWHSRVQLVQNVIGASTVEKMMVISAAQVAGTTAAPSFFNCVIALDPVNGGTPSVNTRNHADNLSGNAYAGVLRYTTGGDEGYSADLSAVQLPTPLTPSLTPDSSSPLYRTGVALPGGYLVEYDQDWAARGSAASIGPSVEYATSSSIDIGGLRG